MLLYYFEYVLWWEMTESEGKYLAAESNWLKEMAHKLFLA